MIKELKPLSYDKSLEYFRIFSSEDKEVGIGRVEVYKIVHGTEKVNMSSFSLSLKC